MCMKQDINCPVCGKRIAKKDETFAAQGLYLYCKRCKKEVKINENEKSLRAKEIEK